MCDYKQTLSAKVDELIDQVAEDHRAFTLACAMFQDLIHSMGEDFAKERVQTLKNRHEAARRELDATRKEYQHHCEVEWNSAPLGHTYKDNVIRFPNCAKCTSILHPPPKPVDKGPYRYLLTMTTTPQNRAAGLTEPRFRHLVEKTLTTKTYLQSRYAVEHVSTNMHAHAFVTTTSRLTTRNFNSFQAKAGSVDIAPVTRDNGIDTYMAKEPNNIIKILR